MIVVRVELWSARDGSRRELARMKICNVGGVGNSRDYRGVTYRGRSTDALNAGVVTREGKLTGFPSETLHVWNLVARMLAGMGYA